MRFKPKSVIILKRDSSENIYWHIQKGAWFRSLFRAWQRMYSDLEDKGRITRIEITVIREK